MNKYDLEIKINVTLTDEDISDIMVAALEGGISYWCNHVEVVGKYIGDYASDQIAGGGSLLLHDAEEDEVYELNLEKFIKGFELWVAGGYDTYGAVYEGVIDTGEIDAEKADQICQLALFGEIIFG